ncbi:AAA family ATPase [Colletotrichum sojae]|uniref:AAA family ATPase n=1 Tax=Colletotrichum sojae TaxID=2175907 RepID=A0A8H6J5W8_9PEZI|nr:AAA family ATPase [Colletotrichum sojae]
MVTIQTDPRRASRLLKVFRDVTKGEQAITTPANARLFLEAVRTNSSPVTCLEIITSSSAAQNAIRNGIRIDSSLPFIKTQILPFIAFLSDPGVKMVCNGQLLHQILQLIVQPPVVWGNILRAYRDCRLDEEDLQVLAWLCFELASFPGKDYDGIIDDISSALEQKPFKEVQDHRTRELTYRIKKVLALRSSASPEKDVESAGGRHDNDFANFREISIFPTSDEFYSSARPFYRRATEVAAANPTDRPGIHLDNQFRLLREDMLGELRDDLNVATGKKRGKKRPQILAGLTPAGIDTGDEKRGRFCAVKFTCWFGLEFLKSLTTAKRKKFLDENKSFLRHQSFGALCGDNHIVAFAFLIRDVDELLKAPPVVALQFTDSDALARALRAFQSPNNLRFVLVDTPVFAYEPVLGCLQEITEMPLEDSLFSPETDEDGDSRLPLDQPASVSRYARLLEQALAEGSGTFDLGRRFQLDRSQVKAVLRALQRAVAIIQGPPGTGKSFVGALAAKILMKDPAKRVLVLSYTNHALDQFLEDLIKIGISADLMVRLGSKSTETTATLSLEKRLNNSNAKRSREMWTKIDMVKGEMAELRDEIEHACGSLMRGRVSSQELLDSLEFSEDAQDFFEAFALPEQDDGFQLAGKEGKAMSPDYLFDRWAQGQGAGQLRRVISPRSRHIWTLPNAQRLQYVETWKKRLRDEQIESVERLVYRFDAAQRKMDTLFNESKCIFIQSMRLVGCTTTAAAKYKSLIKAFKPDIVLVEEAGEILEAHVLTALHPATSQLILIGDHKQLRPKINNYALSVEKGEGFDLNRSLFERLILQGHEHVTLQKQHRMHPDISCLVRKMTYPDLLDSAKTLDRMEPQGLRGRVSFVNHSHPEDLVGEIADRCDVGITASKRNPFEAQMVLKLVRYLGQQGYKTDNIVVLTPYLGQLRLLRDMLSEENDPVLNDMDSFELIRAGLLTAAAGKVKSGSGRIKLSTIDNYQGEESDIVIASMTRSNNKGDIGFMKAPERLNVLCSRARECLVMIGNMETFMASPQGKAVWLPFFALLKEKEYLHDGVAVRCQQHPEKTALLKSPEDFDSKCPDGGCDEKCNALLSCGRHTCRMRCHRIANHSKVVCLERIQKTCDRNHNFSVRCTEKDAVCHSCRKEDEDTRRRLERDLKMEKDRLLAQSRYAQELRQMEDEIDHERRRLKYAQEEEEEKKQLEQTRADLQALKETRARTEAMKAAAAAKALKNMPGVFPGGEKPWTTDPIPFGSAQEEWEKMKSLGAASAALDTLMGMIGLESVKQEFLSIKSKVDVALMQDISLSKERFGCTLLGNPGTGKTTVARIYVKFLTSMGVIAGSCFKETTGSKLATNGVPGCQQLLDDVLEDGGGVIFIDEAYQLSSGNSSGGKAVLDFLLAEVENLTGKIVFVLAGYNKQMESFFAHNPGFPSRFPIEMKFDDYDDDELLRILKYQINKKYAGRMKWEDDLFLRVACRRLGRGRGKEGFGNARAIENMLAVISSRQGNRIRVEKQDGTTSDVMLLTKEDLIGPEPAVALQKCKAWRELQGMIGLASVKESVKSLVDSIQTNYHRELAEEPVIEYTFNKVFLGSPGTGKTTVAKLYAQVLVDLGLLSNGEVVLKNPADFVGAVLGGSEAQTKGILAATVGKVLVIDEAYGLYGGGGSQGGTSDPFKTAVVDTIVAEVQSVPGDDRCVLLLGYKDQMEEMFQNVNPGLSRRFPLASAFNFEDFNSPELQKILNLKLHKQGFKATDQAKRVAMEMLDRARNRPNFGNAGEIDTLLNDAKARHQRRLSSKQTTQVSTLEALDFDEDFARAERADTNVAKLFEGTVGCEMIVAKLEGFQKNVRSMKELGIDPKENIPFNFLFRGPPGTGKTSTARKMGKVFYDMGFLANAEVVDCSATDLIGQYVGQTGPKVQQLLDKALGRVLFVDEAYRLAGGGFAKEAVDELVDCVTKDKYKGRLVIILAGYDDDINNLLSINPGMSSRFPEAIDFHSLSPENCFCLLAQLLQKQKKKIESKKVTNRVSVDCLQSPSPDFKDDVVGLFRGLVKQASWASARDVESLAKSIFGEALKVHQGTHVVVTEEIVETELDKMFNERESRAKQAGTRPDLSGLQDLHQCQPPPPQAPHRIQTQQATTTAVAEDEADNSEENPADDGDGNLKRRVVRDAGVSDEVWEQLEQDKKAQEEKEKKYKALLKAKKKAQGVARDRVLKELIEEEARRKKEEAERKKAAMMGMCPMGYEWIKQAQGFRCAGGSHFVSNEQIASS